MAINKYTFRWMYAHDFKTTVGYIVKTLNNKVIPSFDDISDEAEAVEEEAYQKLSMSFDPENDDPSKSAEEAYDAKISFYIMADGVKQGVINLFAAGLYHLFEQWFYKFHRRELLWPNGDDVTSLVSWEAANERLTKYYKIDIKAFASWPKVDELRLIANTVKHADGGSCHKLKELRPDLFVSPHVEKDVHAIDLVKLKAVFQPLAGEDFYLSPEEFAKYAEAVMQFWDELATAFDAIEP